MSGKLMKKIRKAVYGKRQSVHDHEPKGNFGGTVANMGLRKSYQGLKDLVKDRKRKGEDLV